MQSLAATIARDLDGGRNSLRRVTLLRRNAPPAGCRLEPHSVPFRCGNRRGNWLLLLLIGLSFAFVLPTAASESDELERLVTQLGDERFHIRQKAAERLARLGPVALQALQAGGRNVDREIRYQCQRLLGAMREQEQHQEIESFLKHYDPSRSYRLEGWTIVRERIGDSPEARSLYIMMRQEERGILAALDREPQHVTEALTLRLPMLDQQFQMAPQESPVGTTATLLLVLGDDRFRYHAAAGILLINQCQQPRFRTAIGPTAPESPLRKITGDWMRRNVDDSHAVNVIMLAMAHDFKEGLVAAERLMRRNTVQPWLRHYAIMATAKLGDPAQHAPWLEPHLTDATQFVEWTDDKKVTYRTQVRDSALAGLLYLHKQDPRSFGFERAEKSLSNAFNPGALGFENDQKRAQALEKWRTFTQTPVAGAARPMPP